MREKLFIFLGEHFKGQRAFIPLLAAVSLLAALLFWIFPSDPLLPMHLAARDAARFVTGTGRVATPRPAVRPVNARFMTMNVGDTISLAPGPVSFGAYPAILSRAGPTGRYRARAPGHTMVTVGTGKAAKQVFIFVSPIPSKQVNREDIDWYKTQYGTGTANCGPAIVAMAILWSQGQDFTVQGIRDEIGYPYDDGALSFDNLMDSLTFHRVPFTTPEISSPSALQDVVDRGHIAVILIQSGGITRTPVDPRDDPVGRYYDDDEGHYVLVKGYSLDGRYFDVYDPYPVDWETNSLRYADGYSMIGRDRYYPTSDIFGALKTQVVIEISPS